MENVAEVIRGLIASAVPKSFVGDFASLDAEGVSVKLDAGEEPTRHFGSPATGIYRPFVVIVARSASYETAGNWLEAIRGILDGYKTPSMGIFLVTPATYLGRDELKMHEFQITYKALIKE